MKLKYGAVSCFIFLLSACDVESTPMPVPLVAAQATQIYSAANAQVAQAQQDYIIAQESYRATVAASERYAATQSAVQSTLDASAISAAQMDVAAAALQVTMAAAQAKMSQIEIVSATHAMTTSLLVMDVQAQKQIEAANDPLKQIIAYFPTCAVSLIPFAIVYVVILIGRAGAARIAGDGDRAYHALALMPPITIFQLASPTAPPENEDHLENARETGNTKTVENGHGNTENSDFELIPYSDRGKDKPLLIMTPDERAELMTVRHEAIGLLSKCVEYYKHTGELDTGVIKRYNDLGMNSEKRGLIVDNLVYSGIASVINNKRSFIVPEIGTCTVALDLIVTNLRRVYPVGYHDRKQQRLEQAVQLLPQRGTS